MHAIALCVLQQSPLLIGCDIRQISADALDILSNAEIIAVNQGELMRLD